MNETELYYTTLLFNLGHEACDNASRYITEPPVQTHVVRRYLPYMLEALDSLCWNVIGDPIDVRRVTSGLQDAYLQRVDYRYTFAESDVRLIVPVGEEGLAPAAPRYGEEGTLFWVGYFCFEVPPEAPEAGAIMSRLQQLTEFYDDLRGKA